jgi:AcrR family transcriptional regulator
MSRAPSHEHQTPDSAPGRAPGRPRVVDDEVIAGAVLQALVERGYDGMTVDHVAQLAGVGRATVYRRWPTKTAMVLDALGRGRFPIPEDPDSGDPRADFESLLQTLQETVAREHRVIAALQLEAARHPDIGEALQHDLLPQRKEVLVGVLRRAATAGLLRTSSDLELVAKLGPALIWEHFALSANEPDPDLPRRITDIIFADRPGPKRSRR